MFSSNLEQIQSQKNKAFAVFVKTREQLKTILSRADVCMANNEDKIFDLKKENQAISEHITEMHLSLAQINKIVGEKNV